MHCQNDVRSTFSQWLEAVEAGQAGISDNEATVTGEIVSIPALLDISIYLFVNAMTTVSAVVFIYGPHTTLASVAVLNMDDAGDIAPAAAMAMMIFYSNLGIRALQSVFAWWLERRTQAWRKR